MQCWHLDYTTGMISLKDHRSLHVYISEPWSGRVSGTASTDKRYHHLRFVSYLLPANWMDKMQPPDLTRHKIGLEVSSRQKDDRPPDRVSKRHSYLAIFVGFALGSFHNKLYRSRRIKRISERGQRKRGPGGSLDRSTAIAVVRRKDRNSCGLA